MSSPEPAPPRVRQISALELKAMLDAGAPFEFVDVRTPEEREMACIAGSRLLDKAYGDHLLGLDRDTPLVFQCHHGIRSQSAADYCIREGFTITQKIPATLFPDYVTRFTALANTMPEKYHRRHDLTGHFLNWSRIQFQNESKKQNNGSQKFTFDLNKSLSEADEWLAKHNREMAAERAMRGQ